MKGICKVRIAAVLLMTLCGTGAFGKASAVEPHYAVSGIITDAETNEPIVGATIMLKDSYTGVAADVDGHYRLGGLEAGDYVFVVSFISYETKEIACRVAGDIDGLNVALRSDAEEMEAVVVKAKVRSDTEIAMLGAIKAMPQVSSGISAAQISKGPDRDASEVVRRIPGITVIDDRFVIVRGLSQRYNNTWLNGLSVPSTETDSRAFSFDMIPSSQIDNLIVYKSPSPELPGDFAGGFVKIVTKGMPDRNAFSVSYGTGFNVRTQFSDFLINPGSWTDHLGFDGGKRQLQESFPHMQLLTDPDRITDITRNGFNTDWSVRRITPVPDQRLTLSLARRFTNRRGTEVGTTTAINYSNTYKGITGIKNARYGIYSAASDQPIYINDYNDNQYSHNVRVGAMHNWAFVLDPSNRIEFKNLFNLMGLNRLTQRTGIKDVSSPQYQEQVEMLYSSRLTYTGQLAGTHYLTDRDATITWNAGYSYASKDEPDRRIVENYAGISDNSDIVEGLKTNNEHIKRYFQNLQDHIASASLDYEQTFTGGRIEPTLRTGFYGEYRYRDYTQREFQYNYDNLSVAERQEYLGLPFAEMMDNRWLSADRVYVEELTHPDYDYSADVYSAAAYAAVDLPLGPFSIYAGVRLENYMTILHRNRAAAPGYDLMTNDRRNDFDVLPSVNLTYKFNDRHQLRAAYGRSLNRPELRELSPAVYYDFDLFSEIQGNADLKTARVDNVDLRYEFYPAPGETISLGAFYKHFADPIEWTYCDMGGTLRYQYENARAAQSMGVELEVRKNLEFMAMPNLSLVLNAAYIYSRVTFNKGEVVTTPDRPMQGQSPYVINAGLYYNSQRLGLSATLLYNRIGKRLVGLGKSNSINPDPNTLIPDSYEMPRNVLDFSISKTIGRYVTLTLAVKDILSEDIVYKQFPTFVKDGQTYHREQVTRRYNPGQNVMLTVSAKF